MQNLKPLQTSKKIMSNKEAMEELNSYKPEEEPKEKTPEQNLETKINNNFKNNDLYKEALELYDKINSQVKRKDSLYNKISVIDTDKFTSSNAAMAIFNYLLENKQEAEKLCGSINDEIGVNKFELHRHSTHDYEAYTYDNALMGIVYKILGEGYKAEELYDNIKTKIKKKGGLYNHGVKDGLYRDEIFKKKCVNANASMAILAYLLGYKQEAEELYNETNKRIGKGKDGLFYSKKGFLKKEDEKCAGDNALMGILNLLLGKKEEAKELYKKINSKIKKSEYGLYCHGLNDLDKYTDDNALIGVLCLLLSGKGLK